MKVAILGVTGYTGLELLRLLQQHPNVEITYVSSDSQAGEQIVTSYPHLAGVVSHLLHKVNFEQIANCAEYVFIALPSGVSTELVPSLLAKGLKVIDLAGDHRLPAELYQTWYKKSAPQTALLERAVYGLPELYADKIKQADLIANPGCYPTATLLGLMPLVKLGMVDPHSLVIDAKSGVSGAGKALSSATHFVEVNENFKAYKVGEHQHIPEIEQVLTDINPHQQAVYISFTTHLLPITRGILVTSYAQLVTKETTAGLLEKYQQFYQHAPFVRIHSAGSFPQIKDVRGSNFCDIGLRVDERTGRVTVISVIDNLVKGAAGQAIQNLNLLAGLPETTGLTIVPLYL